MFRLPLTVFAMHCAPLCCDVIKKLDVRGARGESSIPGCIGSAKAVFCTLTTHTSQPGLLPLLVASPSRLAASQRFALIAILQADSLIQACGARLIATCW